MSGLRARRPQLPRLEIDTVTQRLLEEGKAATARTALGKLTACERDLVREFQILDDFARKETQGSPLRLPRFNPNKDLCDDVLPSIDHGARTLSGGYINASLLHGTPVPHFIAAQGPLERTIEDFWSMIASYRVTQIVALCDDDECAGYVPNMGESLRLLGGTLSVRLKSKECSMEVDGLLCSRLEVSCGGDVWEVTRLHCAAWGDEDTLPAASLLCFAELVDKQAATVVHCRAGAGRTGCFIALCSLLADVENQRRKLPGSMPFASIARTVMDLRTHRSNMVQTRQQYELLYSALRLWYRNLPAFLLDADEAASTTDGEASSEEATPCTAKDNSACGFP